MKFKRGEVLAQGDEKGDLHKLVERSFTRRVLIAVALVMAGMAGLLARMFHLQVKRHAYYSTRSQNNRIRIKPLLPERGTIYDARGIALTENILRYRVMVNPSLTQNLSRLLVDVGAVLPISEQERADFLERYQASRRYESVLLKDSIGEDEYYRLSVKLYEFPGVEIEPYYQRYYPYGELTAHVVGYTNRIGEKDLLEIDAEAYRGIHFIGRAGIERQYEALLRGKTGFQQVETDANGYQVRLLREVPAQRGRDIYLSLDLALQRFIYAAFGAYRGSCVVIDPRDGGVLAIVSKPSFDPNLFAEGISRRHYRRLLEDPHAPLYDRALSGRYPPGSVIKPAMLLAGLYYRLVDADTTVFCPGYYTIPNSQSKRRFHCWKRSGHGSMDARQALAQSCDVYFYSLGFRLGIDRIGAYLGGLGIGRRTGIDLPGEGSGLLPGRRWKEKNYKTAWYIGDTVNVIIGQGYLTTTPLQLACLAGLIARDGKTCTPRLLKYSYDPQTMRFVPVKPLPGERVANYEAGQWRLVRAAMEETIHSPQGTGYHIIGKGLRYRMAGKSGTVQVVSFKSDEHVAVDKLAKEHRDNEMFIAYAPAKAPKLALSIAVERSGGSHTSSLLARKISDFYLLHDEGRSDDEPR